MTYPVFDRFPFQRNGHANRRDRDAQPGVLIVDAAHYLDADGFSVSEVVVHIAGDEYTHVLPIADAAKLIKDMTPADAFWLGRAVEGADIEVASWA